MRKFEQLSKFDQLFAIILTKSQEFLYRLTLMTTNKRLSDWISDFFDYLSLVHYKIFAGIELEDVSKSVVQVDKKQAMKIIKRNIVPFARRNALICLKALNEKNPETWKMDKKTIEVCTLSLTISIIKRIDTEQSINLLNELIWEAQNREQNGTNQG
jgi:hypothetical protein